jgi:hypothetical protein
VPIVRRSVGAGANHHFGAGLAQFFENARDVASVVLPVAIHPDHVFETELEGQLVAGLHGAAQTEVVRQGQNPGARRARLGHRRILRTIVDHQHRHAGDAARDFAHHVAHRALFVERGNDHQQRSGRGRPHVHCSATRRALTA